MHRDPLASLFARFQATEDANAFAEVYAATKPALVAQARRVFADNSTIDDLVQSTFLTAIEARGQYDNCRNLMPWLHGILSNHIRHHQRRMRERSLELEPMAHEDIAQEQMATPLQITTRAEMNGMVERAIATLPPHYRATLKERLIADRPPTEIAQRTGEPLATVKSRLQRGLQLLRNQLPFAIGVLLVARAADCAAPLPVTKANGSTALPRVLLTCVAALSIAVIAVLAKSPTAAAPTQPSPTTVVAASETPATTRTSVDRTRAPIPPSPDAPSMRTITLSFAEHTEDQPISNCTFRILKRNSIGDYIPVVFTQPGRDGSYEWPTPAEPGHYAIIAMDESGDRHIREVNITGEETSLPTFVFRRQVAITGIVRLEEGQPAAGADIWVQSTIHSRHVIATSDADGKFEAIAEAAQRVWAQLPQRGPSKWLSIDGKEDTLVADLRIGGPVKPVTITIRNHHHQPVAAAKVLVDGGNPSRPWLAQESDDSGTVSVSPVPAKEHDIIVLADGWAPLWERRPHATTRTNVILGVGATIRGVIRAQGGQPIENAKVQAVMAEAPEGMRPIDIGKFSTSVRTDADGRYELPRVAAGTPMTLYAFAGGLEATWEQTTFHHGQEQEWSPTIGAAGVLSGVVTSHGGTPAAAIEVWARPARRRVDSRAGIHIESLSNGKSIARPSWVDDKTLATLTNSSGQFTLHVPDSGNHYELWACTPGNANQPRITCGTCPAKLPGSKDIGIYIPKSSGSLRAQLKGWGADVLVQMVPAIGGPVDAWTASPAHELALPRVPVGSYSLILTSGEQRLATHVVIAGPRCVDLGVLQPE